MLATGVVTIKILPLPYIKNLPLFIFLLATNICIGQKKIIFRGGTPVKTELGEGVLKRLQLNFDYSIILSFSSSWDTNPNYYILAKKDDSLTAWRYNKTNPSRLRKDTKTDTTLHQLKFERVKLDGLLGIIFKNDLANVSDEAKDTYGCPIGGTKVMIYDGGSVNFIIITKQEYREISFYAPEFFEEKCPGSVERQAIIACEQAFMNVFEKMDGVLN